MRYFIMLLLSVSVFQVHAQLKGFVFEQMDSMKMPVSGATVKLLKSRQAVFTDNKGLFELTLPQDLPDTLVIVAFGYYADTVVVDKKDRFSAIQIQLYPDHMLQEVVVDLKRKTHSIVRMKTLSVEELTSGELRKAACCNLSESFETNASVDVNITDAISGAKKIQLLGIDGIYTQLQLENIPWLRGLESAFGLNSIPGTWLQSIQITKGAGTVVNGYESMAGLVNLELKKPETMEKFYFNAYQNRFGRSELNLNAGHILNDKWSTGWFVHGAAMNGEIDHNRDGFRDIPMGTNFALLNRWKYQGKKMEAQIGVNAYNDQKTGGQTSSAQLLANTDRYRMLLHAKSASLFAKTGFYLKKPANSIGVIYNLKYQTVDAQFGNRIFNGEEKRAYINAIYNGIIGTTDHAVKAGFSFVYADIVQHLNDSIHADRKELVPGAFGEYTYTGTRWNAVLGARLDYHNLYGWQFSPRIHAKYKLSEKTDVRFTAGKGWRVPNYMIDNISLLASSRNWQVPDTVKPEISWNIGASLVHEFQLFGKNTTINADFYHTEFVNQLLVDRDANAQLIVFQNLEGRSFSNAFQVEADYALLKNLDVRLAYKLLDVRATYGGEMQQQVMIPRQRFLVNVAYKTRNKRWEFDVTVSVIGKSRLPGYWTADSSLAPGSHSQVYALLNSQITYNFKRWEFYLGGENLTNYKQKNAIIDAENPFGNQFDATMVWAPVMGVNIYAGVRFSIPRKTNK